MNMKKEIAMLLYNILGQMVRGYLAQMQGDRREVSKILAEFQEWIYFEIVHSEEK